MRHYRPDNGRGEEMFAIVFMILFHGTMGLMVALVGLWIGYKAAFVYALAVGAVMEMQRKH